MIMTCAPSSEIFKKHREALSMMQGKRKADFCWEELVQNAAKDLAEWRKDGKKQKFTPEELAHERMARLIANDYERANIFDISLGDTVHQAETAEYIRTSGLREKLIAEGKAGNKLGSVEISARLLPALTFPDSSHFFEVGLVPYGKASRTVLGETSTGNFTSAETAEESARNLIRNFKVHYALAETSTAPRSDVPKSRRSPEIFICGIRGDDVIVTNHQVIETPFRAEFNAIARSLMCNALEKLYA